MTQIQDIWYVYIHFISLVILLHAWLIMKQGLKSRLGYEIQSTGWDMILVA